MCKVIIENQEFKTIDEAAKFLEVKPSYLAANLGPNGIIEVNGFKVQRVGKKREHKKLICLETKEVYNTMTDLADAIGIPLWTISTELSTKNVFKHNGKSYFKLSDKSILNRTAPINTQRGHRHTTVICKQTGEVFESIKVLSERLNVANWKISNALLKDKKFIHGGLVYIKYVPTQQVIKKIEEVTPIQITMDTPIQPTGLSKENAVTVIKNLCKDNIDAGQYYVVKVLIDVLEKLENKSINLCE